MKLYIFSRDTLVMQEQDKSPLDVDSFSNLPIAVAGSDTGMINLATELSANYENAWALTDDGILFVIEETQSVNGITKIKVADASQAFDRELVYSSAYGSTFGAVIQKALNDEYKNCSDTAYDMPYLTITNTDSTSFVMPKMEYNRFVLSEIISLARQNNVSVDFAIVGITNKQLSISISTISSSAKNIVFGDGHSSIDKEAFNRNLAAKVTIAVSDNTGETVTYTYYNYYLADDGTISTTIPANRAIGRWVYKDITHQEDDQGQSLDPTNAYNKAVEAFAQNINSHKVNFYSDRDLHLYDTVHLLIAGSVYTTQITAIQKSSSDNRKLFICGELALTLTEKLKALEKKVT